MCSALPLFLNFPDQSCLVDFLFFNWVLTLWTYMCVGMHAASFVSKCACLSANAVCCVFPCPSVTENDEKLLCTCENEKGTCVNGTCRGDICFYYLGKDYDEKGCFFQKNYLEQCSGSSANFYVFCCKKNLCNAFATPPPQISKYPEQLIYYIWT